MNRKKFNMLRFLIIIFLFVKLCLIHFGDGQSTDIQDLAVSKRGEVTLEQNEV